MRLPHIDSKHKPKVIVGAAIILLLLLMFGRPRTTVAPIKEQSWNVTVQTIEKREYAPTIELYGKVESPQVAKLEAPIAAYVKSTPASEGDRVKKGELLVELDDRDAKYLVEQRQAEVDELKGTIKSELTRYEADKKSLEDQKILVKLKQNAVDREAYLEERKLGSKSRLDISKENLRKQTLLLIQRTLSVDDHVNRLTRAKAKLARSEAMLKQAELDLERTQIRAPFTGRITRMHVAVGDRVTAGETVLQVYDASAVEVRAQIQSRYLREVQQALQEAQQPTPKKKSKTPEAKPKQKPEKIKPKSETETKPIAKPKTETTTTAPKKPETKLVKKPETEAEAVTQYPKGLPAWAISEGARLTLVLDRLAGSVGVGRAGVDGLFKITSAHGHLALGRSLAVILELPKQKNLVAVATPAIYGADRVYKVVDERLVEVKVERVGELMQPGKPRQVLMKSNELKNGDRIITTQIPQALPGTRVTVIEK